MSMKEIILRDAKMCAYVAGNVEHFKYLMKRLGYVFKKDAWMELQELGFRYYHKLAKLDEMFSEDMLRHHVDIFLSLLSVIDSIKFHSSDYLDALEMGMKPQEGSQYWVYPIIVEYMNDRFDKKLLQYI